MSRLFAIIAMMCFGTYGFISLKKHIGRCSMDKDDFFLMLGEYESEHPNVKIDRDKIFADFMDMKDVNIEDYIIK